MSSKSPILSSTSPPCSCGSPQRRSLLALQVSEIAKEIKIFKTVDKYQKHDENTLDDIVTNEVDNSSPNIEQPTPLLEPEADATPPCYDELNESFASIEEFMDAETNEIDEDVQAF